MISKLALSKGKVKIIIPKRGLSKFDNPLNKDFEWYDPQANAFLFAEIKRLVKLLQCQHISIQEENYHINDAGFANVLALAVLDVVKENKVHDKQFKDNRLFTPAVNQVGDEGILSQKMRRNSL